MAIRITPLIDVVFILLVFFMLTTRLLPVDILEVSTDAHSASAASTGEPMPEVRILPHRQLQWNGDTYSLEALIASLLEEGVGQVNVTSAPQASVQDFTLTLSALNERGIEPNWMRENRTRTQP